VSKLKLHLGCGEKRIPEHINVDYDARCKPDQQVNLEETWPWEDNSVSHVVAHHLVEHLGDKFIFFMQELYRVCAPGAIIDIVVPHHRHDCFLNDPTHKRPITVEGMRLFDQSFNNHCLEVGDGASKLGLFYSIDFAILKFNFIFDSLYAPLLDQMQKLTAGSEEQQKLEQEIGLMIREKNNVILETHILLQAVK